MGRFWFVRHGESVANAEGWLAGHRDVPLTGKGVAQAIALRPVLAALRPERVLASDLRRAWQTGAIAWEDRQPVIERTAGLRERHLGAWEGASIADLARIGGMDVLLSWTGVPPEGESQRRLSLRVLSWLDAHDDGRDTLVFAHGGLIRCVIGLLDGVPTDRIGLWKVGNTDVHERPVRPGTWAALLRDLG